MARPPSFSREELEETARAVFVEFGPNASVKQIAERLGVTHAALFQRFGSKAEILRVALCPGKPEAAARLRAEPPAENAERALIEIVVSLMAFLEHVIPNLVVLKASGLDIDEALGARRPPAPVALRGLLADWLRRAGELGALPAPEDPAIVAESLLGTLEARAFNRYLGGEAFAPGSDVEVARDLVHFALETDP